MTHGLIGEPFEFIDLVFGRGDEFYPCFVITLIASRFSSRVTVFQLIQMVLETLLDKILMG